MTRDGDGDGCGEGCGEGAHVLALASLPGMGPRRLRAVLTLGSPQEAWRAVRQGTAVSHPRVAEVLGAAARRIGADWQAAGRSIDVDRLWAGQAAAGSILWRGGPGFPPVLAADIEPPELLFAAGDVGAVDAPRVAIVGTRRCTRYGRDVAWELGRDLASAGACVVSGLALGIDGAAHEGALAAGAAPPVAVVATGLDVVYPRRHQSLWGRVAAAGVILTEAPLGTAPERWRFPARNRIIAAMADVVVVVESHAAGGSLITVTEALERDRVVMAVPGPVRSAASAGTNRLLHDGLPPVRDAGDVLMELGLSSAVTARRAAHHVDPADQPLLDALGWEPATLDLLVARLGTSPGEVAVRLARLEGAGVVASSGGWWERVA